MRHRSPAALRIGFLAAIATIAAAPVSAQHDAIGFSYLLNSEGRFGAAAIGVGNWTGTLRPEIVVGVPDAPNAPGRFHILGEAYAVTTFYAPLNGHAGDRFGAALASAGDLDGDGRTDIVVGAPNHDLLAPGRGRIEVMNVGPMGVPVYLFEVFGDAAGDGFGTAVDGGFDVNGDAIFDILVGAPGHDTGGLDAGRVRVLSGAGGAVLATFDGATGAAFGAALAWLGDVNGDAVPDFIVGAPRDNAVAASAGRAVVFSGATGAPLYTYLGVNPGDRLGTGVARLGDIDGDGVQDFGIGSPGDDFAAIDAGAASIYSGASGALIVTLRGAAANQGFGEAVAAADDFNADGRADFAVGSPSADFAGVDSGAVQVFSGRSRLEIFRCDGATAGDRFGATIAMVGDGDLDGRPNVLVGAPEADGIGLSPTGSLAILPGTGTAVMIPGALPRDGIFRRATLPTRGGVTVPAILGDLDGDGAAEWGHAAYYNAFATTLDIACVHVYDGATGRSIAAIPDAYRLIELRSGGATAPGSGDVTGDGVADYAVTRWDPTNGSSAVEIRNGATHALHVQLPLAAAPFFVDDVLAAGVDDLDFDGAGDVIVSVADPLGWPVAVHSGATGALIRVVVPPANATEFGGAIEGVGDLDGDGAGDFVVTGRLAATAQDAVFCYSGWTGALLWTQVIADPLGSDFHLATVGDVDADGISDIAWSLPQTPVLPGPPGTCCGNGPAGTIVMLSGASGAILWQFTPPFGNPIGLPSPGITNSGIGASIAEAGDLTGDGRPDLWVATFSNLVTAFDGATGAGGALVGFPGFRSFGGTQGDVSGDGIIDLAATPVPGNAADYPNSVVWSPEGAARYGRGVGDEQMLDLMWRSSLGASFGLTTIDLAPPFAPGFVAATVLQPRVGSVIGVSVVIDLWPGALALFPVSFDALGRLSVPLDLTAPGFSGLRFVAQAFAFDPSAPNGWWSSNGLSLQFF